MISNPSNELPTTITNYSNDYHDVINEYNVFLGVILNGDKAERAFICSTYNGNPFCIEGTLDGSKHTSNARILQHPSLRNGGCDDDYYSEVNVVDCTYPNYDYIESFSNGYVWVATGRAGAFDHFDGRFGIYTS